MPDKKLIESIRDDELTPSERQQTRYTNAKVINEMVDLSEIQKRHEQHDQLWAYYGWVPTLLANWKVVAGAIAIAVIVGGQDMIANIAKILGGYVP